MEDRPEDYDAGAAPRARTDLSTASTLLHRARTGDADAWRRLVDLYAPLVYYWCRRFRLQPDDIDDIVQDVFHGVAVGLKSFRRNNKRGAFRGWLLAITRNKIADFLRRRGRQPAAQGGESYDQLLDLPDQLLSESELSPMSESMRVLYHRALEILRTDFEPRVWKAFWETTVEGRPATEVAEELDMRVSAVYNAKSRVLRRLRDELGADLL